MTSTVADSGLCTIAFRGTTNGLKHPCRTEEVAQNDLAVSLATGGRFLGYYNVPEPKRMAMFSGESGMATIQETALRVCKAANVELASTGIIFCETLPRFGDPVNMEAFRRFLDADGIEVVIIDPV